MADLTRVSLADAQAVLPGHRDWRKEQDAAAAKKVDSLMETWNKGLSGEALYLAKILILCGLPVTPTGEAVVSRTARIGKYERITVSFSVTDKNIPLPYGKDRLMAHFLTNKAVQAQSTLLDWNDINEYLSLFGKFERSGRNHKLAQASFIRLAFMNISITSVNTQTDMTYTIKVPLMEAAAIQGSVDEATGKWTAKDTPKKMLKSHPEMLRVGPVFFSEFLSLKKAVPVPIELVLAAGDSPRILDYAVFLYWRCFSARSETVITWDQLRGQFDNRDGNLDRWRAKFREVMVLFKTLPYPFNLIHVKVTKKGIELAPFPEGVEFFEGHPKLKFAPSSVAE